MLEQNIDNLSAKQLSDMGDQYSYDLNMKKLLLVMNVPLILNITKIKHRGDMG